MLSDLISITSSIFNPFGNMMTMTKMLVLTLSLMTSARGFEAVELSSSTVPDLTMKDIESDIHRPFMPTVAGKGGFGGLSVDDLLSMMSVQKESASRFFIGFNVCDMVRSQ